MLWRECFFFFLLLPISCLLLYKVWLPKFLISLSLPARQPLAKCMHSLQLSNLAIGLQLSEPWLREYQVSTWTFLNEHAFEDIFCTLPMIGYVLHVLDLLVTTDIATWRTIVFEPWRKYWHTYANLQNYLSSLCTLQVLPSRTHPHMQMNAFGGYILNGIRIHNPDRVVANKWVVNKGMLQPFKQKKKRMARHFFLP